MNSKLKSTPGIYLVGFMGAGKTTIGRMLAERLGWKFIDLDAEIEQREGASISEIFDTRGEAAFRALEAETIAQAVRLISRGQASVVALGGGAFIDQKNYELVQNHGVTVWLDCPLEILQKRIEIPAARPLARDPDRFAELYSARRQAYCRADYRIPVGAEDATAVVDAILKLPIF